MGFSRSVSRSRSRSQRRRSRTRSAEKARQPCVFYFSKEAKGCKFTQRECKFSHDKSDYESWNDDGRILPNTGLIHRETPVNGSRRRRSYTRSPIRRRSRSRSYRRSRSGSARRDKNKRGRERSFTLSPVRPGGYQPQGFSRAQRGFVNIPPDTVDKFLVETRDLKQKRRLVKVPKLSWVTSFYPFMTSFIGERSENLYIGHTHTLIIGLIIIILRI